MEQHKPGEQNSWSSARTICRRSWHTGVNCSSQMAYPISLHKTRWVSNRLVYPSNIIPRGLVSTGEPVMKTYSLHLYCQQVGFSCWTFALVDEIQEHSIGINLFIVGVHNDIAIYPRQEYLGRGCPFAPDSEHHSGAESSSQSFSPENIIFTIQVQIGDRDSRFAHGPLKLLDRSIMALKERQVLGRMCVINSVLEMGRKTRTLS